MGALGGLGAAGISKGCASCGMRRWHNFGHVVVLHIKTNWPHLNRAETWSDEEMMWMSLVPWLTMGLLIEHSLARW